MRKKIDHDLIQLIIDENVQPVIDLYSSRAFGWISKCNSLEPSQVEGVVESLKLEDTESSAIICHTLQTVLEDIDEHEEYSENFGSEDEINGRITELKNKMQIKDGFQWEKLYKLAEILEGRYDNFSMYARKMLPDEKQRTYLTEFEDAKRAGRPDVILNTTDFTFMSPLLDEAIFSLLAQTMRFGASNFSEPEERELAEKTFEAFEYYSANRPMPQCFSIEIITQAIQMTARWLNPELAKKIEPYIDQITPTVYTYTSLCRYYSTYNNREKLIESLKMAERFGTKESFRWATGKSSPWKDDEEVQSLIPKSIFNYPL